MTDPTPSRNPLAALPWALYLACSWTWCIGMFLPTLLVRDAGKLGFVVFIVPNAIGAGLVGWVLAGRARAFFESKRPLILWFTAATIAFHGYWIVWRFAEPIAGNLLEFTLGIVVSASLVLNAIAATRKVRGLAALLTLVLSLGAAFGLLAYPAGAPMLAGTAADLAGLAVVCALGFGLCPYLDITFNKCTIESARPRLAFTLGFILFALVLLVVTRGRAWLGLTLPNLYISEWLLAGLVGGHFGAQTTFTVAAHIEAVRTTARTRVRSAEGVGWIVAPALIGLTLGWIATQSWMPGIAGMSAPEVGYRSFLGLYGLVFPAWLILTIGNRPPFSTRTLTALAIVCAVALPFFAYGFIWLEEVWLIPGVAVVLLGRLLADQRQPSA
ncbi:MAG: hypothetical protein RIB60_05600 [Phycisphaerales bacterium]